MAIMSMIFIWFYVGYKHGYMARSCHGYLMYLSVIVKWMDARPNRCYSGSMEKVVILLVMLHNSFQ